MMQYVSSDTHTTYNLMTYQIPSYCRYYIEHQQYLIGRLDLLLHDIYPMIGGEQLSVDNSITRLDEIETRVSVSALLHDMTNSVVDRLLADVSARADVKPISILAKKEDKGGHCHLFKHYILYLLQLP